MSNGKRTSGNILMFRAQTFCLIFSANHNYPINANGLCHCRYNLVPRLSGNEVGVGNAHIGHYLQMLSCESVDVSSTGPSLTNFARAFARNVEVLLIIRVVASLSIPSFPINTNPIVHETQGYNRINDGW